MALTSKFSFPTPAYKISKAVLDMLTVQYALAFAKEGFTFVALFPGVSIGFLSSRPDPCP
jgi:NAD(P)-dependent dehydrogenase (short-subunit alcohol dehydrogenase family)